MKDTPDSQLREQVYAIVHTFDKAFNNNDAIALAALFTDDAVLVTDTGLIYHWEAIKKYYAELLQKFHFSDHIGKVDRYSPHSIGTAGNEAWATGEWTQTVQGQNFGPLDEKGYWTCIYAREGDVWKVRVNTWNRLKDYSAPPPEPAKTK
jgi:ketosteroid isomerase-like protein